jgi:hypothetical protein
VSGPKPSHQSWKYEKNTRRGAGQAIQVLSIGIRGIKQSTVSGAGANAGPRGRVIGEREDLYRSLILSANLLNGTPTCNKFNFAASSYILFQLY